MKKLLLLLLLLGITVQAQTFNFGCEEPILVTIYSQNTYVNGVVGIPYGVVRYSSDNNILRQMSIVSAVDGVTASYRNIQDLSPGSHVLTIAIDVDHFNITDGNIEQSEKIDINVIIYDCEGNRPISEDLEYSLEGNVLTLDIDTLPQIISSWSLFGSIIRNDTLVHFEHSSDGRSAQSIRVNGIQSPYDYTYNLDNTFPSFNIPNGEIDNVQFSYNTGICGYGGFIRNSAGQVYIHNWIEISFGIWENVNYPGWKLDRLTSYQNNNWNIRLSYDNMVRTTFGGYAFYGFDNFLYMVSEHINLNYFTYYQIPRFWNDFTNTGSVSGAGDIIYRYKDTNYVLLIAEGNVRYGVSTNGTIIDIISGYDVDGQDWDLQQAADALVKYINIAGDWEIYSFTDETGQEVIWNELEASLTQLIPEYSCLSYVLEVNTRNFIETFTNVDVESRGCLPPNITTFTYNVDGNLYTFQQGDVTVANTILFSNNNNTMTWTNTTTNEVKIWNRK